MMCSYWQDARAGEVVRLHSVVGASACSVCRVTEVEGEGKQVAYCRRHTLRAMCS